MKNTLLTLLLLLAPLAAHAQLSTDDAFEFLPMFHYGQNDEALSVIHRAVIAAQGDRPACTALNEKLLAVLPLPDAETDAKIFACKMLMIIGDDECVPGLAALLLDPALGHAARYALENLPGTAADLALYDALFNAEDDVKVGLINSLAMRRTEIALPMITDLAESAERRDVREAAIAALGRLGEDLGGALNALNKLWAGNDPAWETAVGRALVQAASARADQKNGIVALKSVLKQATQEPLQVAAAEGLLSEDGAAVSRQVLAWMQDGSTMQFQFALDGIRRIGDEEFLHAVEKQYAVLDVDRRCAVLGALAAREVFLSSDVVLTALDSESAAERRAAMAAAAVLRSDQGLVLGKLLDFAETDERSAAVAAMASMPGDMADDLLMGMGPGLNTDPAKLAMLIEVLGARRTAGAFTMLRDAVSAPFPEVADAAIDAMGQIATPEQAEFLVSALLEAPDAARAEKVGAALTTLLRRSPEDLRAKPILDALDYAEQNGGLGTLLRVAGAIGHPDLLPAVTRYAATPGLSQLTAIGALAQWPTAEPLDSLNSVAKESEGDVRLAALRGYLRQLRASDLDDTVKFARYADAMNLTDDTDIQRTIIAGLGELKDKQALDFVEQYLDSPGLKRESRVAAERIRSNFYELTASDRQGDAGKALDGDINTRWTTGRTQAPGMWFQLDMGSSASIGGIVLDASRSPTDTPVRYAVYVFDDPAEKGAPVAEGDGDKPVLDIRFDPKPGRYVRIEQSGTSDSYYWSIHELRVVPR